MQADVFDTQAFGHRLREARKKAGLSQADLAAQLGVHQPWISEMEHGGQGPISATTLMHLARALGVSTDYLLGLSDAPPTTRRRRHQQAEASTVQAPVMPLRFGLWKGKLPPDWEEHFDDLDEELIRMFEGEDDEDEADVPTR